MRTPRTKPIKYWFGTENGDNILVAPGEYTITLNPAEKTVTVK